MLVCPAIFWTLFLFLLYFGRCYCQYFWATSLYLTDVIAMLPYCGRCYTTRSDVITCFLLWWWCCYHSCLTCFGRCFCHCSCDWWYCHNFIIMLIVLTDVMPSGDVPLIVIVAFGQLLCPMADVIATSWILMFARCCCQVAGVTATVDDSSCLADVIPKVGDGMPTMGVVWQML